MPPAGENLHRVAQVLKSNGTEGELVIGLYSVEPEEIDTQEPVFLYFEGLPVPYFFESFRERGRNKAIVRLTGVHSQKDAEELVGQGVYLPADAEILRFAQNDMEGLMEALIGWTLLDKTGALVGEIIDFENIPGNPCLYVNTSRGQIMVPLHDDFICSADPETRVLVMDIPEGLTA